MIKRNIFLFLIAFLMIQSCQRCKDCKMVECAGKSNSKTTLLGEKCGKELKELEEKQNWIGPECAVEINCQ